MLEPAANCYRTGNHLGIQPHGFKDSIEFAVDELEELTGVRVEVPINRKGAEILFVDPLGRLLRPTRTTYTCLGYLMLFHEIGLDYTCSAYASEGGNFGLFTSHEMIKRLNAKIYAEAKRLGVKWILGRRVRPHVAGAPPVHGHHERAGGFPGGAGLARSPAPASRMPAPPRWSTSCEFTADLIQQRQARSSTRAATTTGR